MKVIDLLNKIANGEEVPKEIKLNDNVFIYDETDDNEVNRYRTMTDDFLIDEVYLNDEVEVIEEDKKIEKLYIRERVNDILIGKSEKICYATESLVNKEIALKINEIIDYINKEKK